MKKTLIEREEGRLDVTYVQEELGVSFCEKKQKKLTPFLLAGVDQICPMILWGEMTTFTTTGSTSACLLSSHPSPLLSTTFKPKMHKRRTKTRKEEGGAEREKEERG